MSGLVGPNGQPLSAKAAVEMSEKSAEQKQLEQVQFKMFITRWEFFYTAATFEDALQTQQADELKKMGMDDIGIEKLYEIANIAFNMLNDFPERDVFMAQVIEYAIGILSNHKAILNNPAFIATVACVNAGVIASSKEKEDE